MKLLRDSEQRLLMAAASFVFHLVLVFASSSRADYTLPTDFKLVGLTKKVLFTYSCVRALT
jgi:hypothetical protein